MPFTNDAFTYVDLLDKLRENRESWDGALTFAESQQSISGISGIDADTYAALVEELRTYHLDNDEQMLKQLRLTALAWPASDYGLTGAEWRGYFVTELPGGQQFCATDRFAEPQDWELVEVAAEALALTYNPETGLLYDDESWYLPDGKTVVTLDRDDPTRSSDGAGNLYVRGKLTEGAPTVTDLRKAHFDQEFQRWRRWSDDGGVFEHYHNEDGVWERHRGKDGADEDIWYRHHSAAYGWLRYDRTSDHWLDTALNQWRRHEQIGRAAASTAPDAPELAGVGDNQALELRDLDPELQEFLNELYEINPEHRKIPIRTVLEVVAESERYL